MIKIFDSPARSAPVCTNGAAITYIDYEQDWVVLPKP